MRIVPVLDLMNGQAVRGVGGRRAEYRPVVSRLTASAVPLAVAGAFREHFGLTDLYLADLDAIAGAPPAVALYESLRADGFRLWVDAGIRQAADAGPLAAAGVEGIVAGLETLAGPDTLRELCERHEPERVVFSLDLQGGAALGNAEAWGEPTAQAIAARAVSCGGRRLIVLDLARVGVSTGTGTEALCKELTAAHPGLEVIAGGGVRDRGDLVRLAECGAAAALVASALHDGRLSRADLQGL